MKMYATHCVQKHYGMINPLILTFHRSDNIVALNVPVILEHHKQ